ncbi:MAG: magnesium transporter [Chloroflexi bacterium]|nr:MAG: magnesium transporter [Chloroflexota bacterium]
MKVVMPMIFLSTLLRQSIYDIEGRRLGVLRDICVTLHETFPVVTALVVRSPLGNSQNDMIIPWYQVNSLEEPQIHLVVKQPQVASYTPQSDELLLKRDILDKQIVDTQGFRVVKVNDLKLAQIKKTVRLVGVDISLSGLLRRLGVLAPVETLSRVLPIQLNDRTITWNYVEPIQVVRGGATTGQLVPAFAGASTGTGASLGVSGVVPKVQLNVSQSKLADLRPADIADILEQLDVEDAGAMLERLDTETAADTLNEVEPTRQYELLSELDPERASDLLEVLPPDDAADILADLPPEEAERLLNLMPANESQPIRDLLRYGEETAGGIMTPEVLSLSQELTVEEALVYLRQHSAHLEMIYYLYVVDSDKHLVGVVSLRELVVAEPTTRLQELMDRDVIKVTTDTDQEEVARVISKYDLLGVPVVDSENHLVGLITVDDVIDVLHEEEAEDFSEMAGATVEELEDEEHFSWRAALSRVTWLTVNVATGFAIAFVLYRLFGQALTLHVSGAQALGLLGALRSPLALNGVLFLLPMLLLSSGSVSTQALGVAGWQLRETGGSDFWRGIFRELRLGTVGGVVSSIVVGCLTWLLFHSPLLAVAIGLGFGFTLFIAAICGLFLPKFFQRLHLRGSLVSAPLLDPIIAFISVCIFLVVALWLIGMFHV